MPADDKLSLSIGAVDRLAFVHGPPAINDQSAVPLLLVFHGGRGGPEAIAKLTVFNELANHECFVVAYPQAVAGHWSDGRSTTRARRDDEDDVQFIKVLVSELCSRYPIDRARIYAAGMSNGGMMCHRLGLEMANTFAAIATVAGGMAEEIVPADPIASPLSVIGIYGTADPIIPWEGGEVKRGAGGRLLGARASTEVWARMMDCSADPVREDLPDLVNDGTRVWRETYEGCRDGARVVLYGIEGGGHGWPPHGIGRTGLLARALTGKASRNLDTTETIWQFLRQISR